MTKIHGHRGCRGLMPENTVVGFLHAVDLGVDALELDVVMNLPDRQAGGNGDLLVSHEPWISPRICLDPEGKEIPEEMTERLNLYKMDQREIERYDCGLKHHPWFPEQMKVAATKPLLKDVIDAVETYVDENGLDPIIWNIELKSKEKWYGTFQPQPEPYTRALIDLIREKGIEDRTVVQCFDTMPLEVMHKEAPEIPLALLVDNENGLDPNLNKLSFLPQYYSPNFKLVNPELVQKIREHGMKWLVWTVNEKEDIERMLALKPDGIITDLPGRALNIIGN